MRTFLLHPVFQSVPSTRDPELALAEAESLVSALDVDLARSEILRAAKPDSGKFFGRGKVEELKQVFHDAEIDLVVINGTVSPIQQRNLEQTWKLKVLDRTALILEIFGERARTREGVLQVDLAHLTYQKSRLVRSWTHLERQRGGGGFMGGPGETQIEADRRAIDDAIIRLKRQLGKVVKTRELHRASRKKIPFPIVALVGYTNAGKSTIFNRLTGADVMAKDMVFATLDPTMRGIDLPSGRRVILSDTVGFISDLPTQLVAAFRATLEEVLDADLVVHVRDIAHPEAGLQAENVAQILGDLGIDEGAQDGMIEVWNKVDLLSAEDRSVHTTTAARRDKVVPLSAVTGDGIDALLALIEDTLRGLVTTEVLRVGPKDAKARAWLHQHSLVRQEENDAADTVITVEWDDKHANRFRASFGELRDGH